MNFPELLSCAWDTHPVALLFGESLTLSPD
jgi:hypothetical protein